MALRVGHIRTKTYPYTCARALFLSLSYMCVWSCACSLPVPTPYRNEPVTFFVFQLCTTTKWSSQAERVTERRRTYENVDCIGRWWKLCWAFWYWMRHIASRCAYMFGRFNWILITILYLHFIWHKQQQWQYVLCRLDRVLFRCTSTYYTHTRPHHITDTTRAHTHTKYFCEIYISHARAYTHDFRLKWIHNAASEM